MRARTLEPKGVVEMIHLAYREEESGAPHWPVRLLPALRALLPSTRAAGFYEFTTRGGQEANRFRIVSPLHWLGDELYTEGWRSTLEEMDPVVVDEMFPRTMASMSSAHSISGIPLPNLPGWNTMWRPSVADSLGLCIRDGAERGFLFFTGTASTIELTARERGLLTKLAVHLGAAYRLDRDQRRRLDVAEAILAPSGAVLHAQGVAQTRRSQLDDGRRRRREAIRKGQDPEKALEIWRGLVAGRWSLVDHFDTDGKRFLLALKNAPRAPTLADLTARERRVCALVAMGHRDKEIAYMLGLSLASVTAALFRVRKKLGVVSRVELAMEWKRQTGHPVSQAAS